MFRVILCARHGSAAVQRQCVANLTTVEAAPSAVATLVYQWRVDCVVVSHVWDVPSQSRVPFCLPPGFLEFCDEYSRVYKDTHRLHQSRQLTWLPHEGSAVVSPVDGHWRGDLLVTPLQVRAHSTCVFGAQVYCFGGEWPCPNVLGLTHWFQMSILALFVRNAPLTLSTMLDRLCTGVTHAAPDKLALCKLVHAALLSLTADRHAVLTASKPPHVVSPGLSGAFDVLPFDSDTIFAVNDAFCSADSAVQVHRVAPGEEDQSSQDRLALMAFRRSVVAAKVVQVVKGRGVVPLSDVIDGVRSRLAGRFDVTDAV